MCGGQLEVVWSGDGSCDLLVQHGGGTAEGGKGGKELINSCKRERS